MKLSSFLKISKYRDYYKYRCRKIRFKIFSSILNEYDIDFYFKDKLGILTCRKHSDNFEYIFSNKSSCDAVPMMASLNSIEPGKVAIDIGANIGITSVWLASKFTKVISFEPDSNNIERFKENVTLNNKTNIRLVPKAVSNIDGIAEFNIFDSYGHHSLAKQHSSRLKNVVEVSVTRLDSFLEQENIDIVDVIKIDVEGCELEVLQGAETALKNKKIKMVIFEHSPTLLTMQGRQLTEVYDFLSGFDFNIYTLENELVSVSDIKTLAQCDLYATLN